MTMKIKKNKKSQTCETLLQAVRDRLIAEILIIASKINKLIRVEGIPYSYNENIDAVYKDTIIILRPSGDFYKDEIKHLPVEQLLNLLKMLEDKDYKILSDEQIEDEYGVEKIEDITDITDADLYL